MGTPKLNGFWRIITSSVSLCFCVLNIHNIWIKWDQSPLFMSMTEKSTPVWSIPFPAVTICPETKTYMDKLNFTDAFHTFHEGMKDNMTEEALTRMQSVIHLCDAHLGDIIDFGQNFTTNEIYDIIKEVAPSFNDSMYYCKWRNKHNFCAAVFDPTLTEGGVCFTFNSLNSREIYTDEMSPEMMTVMDNPNATHWNVEDGYNDTGGNYGEIYPLRAFGASEKERLFVVLRSFEQDMEYLCRGSVQGFKVLLHTPGEVPQVSKHYFRVQLSQEVMVSVKPKMITTSEGLHALHPNQRKCFFQYERRLRFFKVYTQRNCELECLSNFTRTECGCVKFSMPRDRDTPICGGDKIKCYNDAEDILHEMNVVEKLHIPSPAPEGCNCLPGCTSLTYDVETSQTKFDWVSLVKAYKNPLDEFHGMQLARFSIFFKEQEFITSKRSESYGLSNFMADIGGLLGLFLGVSVLSIAKVICYYTFQQCWKCYQDKGCCCTLLYCILFVSVSSFVGLLIYMQMSIFQLFNQIEYLLND